ncbi:MAG TPA: hypothetical protein VL283_05910 [Candidatus Baltobacteraceae bacterium]|nr:hypothetical protein [Candidatus Baltobacteraceae bacterium]
MSNAVTQLSFVRNFLRLAWFAAGVGLLAMIVSSNLPPSGILSASARTAEPSGFIDGFSPLDRARPVEEDGRWYSDIVSEPVYFHVAAPKLYDTARVELRYRNEGQPYLALGARTDLDAWSFELKPIDLPMLDDSGWAARQDGDLRIYERKATARSAGEILSTATGRVAVLALDPARWGMRLPDAEEQPFETTLSLPGTRKIYVYVQRGAFDVTLGFRGTGTARVELKKEGKVLLSRTRAADGAVDLAVTGAEAGLYRIDISAPESMSLSGIRSAHGHVALVDAEGEHLKLPSGARPFDPEFPIFTWETDLAKSPFEAIVARYAPPTVDAEGWRTASATFDLHDLAASQGRVQMIVSAPKIRDHGAKIRVDRVGVEYVRPPLDPKKLLDLFKLDL